PAALGLLLLCAAAAGAGNVEELHYPQGEHRTDYDREALLGGQDEVDEYVKLNPEEQHKRLKSIIKKIDLDSDGFLTESKNGLTQLTVEKSLCRKQKRKHFKQGCLLNEFVIQEALEEHDKNGDGFVSLEEFLGDYRRDPTATEDPEWILVEKDRFVNDYDKDNDGRLDPQELLSWVVPNNEGIAQEEALHLIDEMDLNGDRKLSEAEILENQDLFLTSEATDYGRQLHDEYFYHDEL
ncbi:reticulocalbin-2, partial [Trichechus manatus latirostris]|uniref:Reticulocalbin-2 n=1 Tax=Trichechus manatus latirostris TaxID=127582 RepID=A0A2Y9R1W2_TRIMA